MKNRKGAKMAGTIGANSKRVISSCVVDMDTTLNDNYAQMVVLEGGKAIGTNVLYNHYGSGGLYVSAGGQISSTTINGSHASAFIRGGLQQKIPS